MSDIDQEVERITPRPGQTPELHTGDKSLSFVIACCTKIIG
jgi:hypothetical protein